MRILLVSAAAIVAVFLPGCSGDVVARDGGADAALSDSGAPGPFSQDAAVVTRDAGAVVDSGLPFDAGGQTDAGGQSDAGPTRLTRCVPLTVPAASPLRDNPTAKPVFEGAIAGTAVKLTEGPIWDAKGKALYFTEPESNRIWRLTPPSKLEAMNVTTRFGDGMDIVPTTGELVVAENDIGGISFYDLTTFVVKRSVLPPLPPGAVVNDVVARADGTVFVTVPKKNAVYQLKPQGQAVQEVTTAVRNPNGLALSPDEKTLYVVQDEGSNGAPKLFRFNLADDGTVTAPAEKASIDIQESPDGVTVDRAGNVYIAHRDPRLVEVYSSALQSLGAIEIPGFAFNVAFGGDDLKTLFITAFDKNFKGALYRVELPIEGCLQ
jgi:gluconolactonase